MKSKSRIILPNPIMRNVDFKIISSSFVYLSKSPLLIEPQTTSESLPIIVWPLKTLNTHRLQTTNKCNNIIPVNLISETLSSDSAYISIKMRKQLLQTVSLTQWSSSIESRNILRRAQVIPSKMTQLSDGKQGDINGLSKNNNLVKAAQYSHISSTLVGLISRYITTRDVFSSLQY